MCSFGSTSSLFLIWYCFITKAEIVITITMYIDFISKYQNPQLSVPVPQPKDFILKRRDITPESIANRPSKP